MALLERRRDRILDEAADALCRPPLTHYPAADRDRNRARVEALHQLAVRCIRDRTLLPMVEHAQRVARERHAAGYDLQEVQAAFNAFEEVIWRRIEEELPPSAFPRAFGLASTVLGAGKEALALEYVSLASRTRVATLDLSELFRGG